MVVWCLLVLKAQRPIGRKLHFAKCLEHTGHVEVALPENDAVRLFLLFGEVLEVDAVQPIAEFVDHLDRIFGRAYVVTKISAKTDALVVALHRLESVVDLVIKRARAVVVNGYADVVFGYELV